MTMIFDTAQGQPQMSMIIDLISFGATSNPKKILFRSNFISHAFVWSGSAAPGTQVHIDCLQAVTWQAATTD